MPRAVVYVACLRNLEATANELAGHHARVAILGAGERGEVCTEDQMAAAWLAARLRKRGFELEGHNTVNEVERWGVPDVSLIGWSRAAERLRARGRAEDVDFVLRHFDDLDIVGAYSGGEVRNPALDAARASSKRTTGRHPPGACPRCSASRRTARCLSLPPAHLRTRSASCGGSPRRRCGDPGSS